MALSATFIAALQNSFIRVYQSMPKIYLPTLPHELLAIKIICQEHFHGSTLTTVVLVEVFPQKWDFSDRLSLNENSPFCCSLISRSICMKYK